MARDLIPPPSPAGRPEQPSSEAERPLPGPKDSLFGSPPPGETALQAESAKVAREEAEEPPRELPRLDPDSPYRSRFGFLLGALIGIGVAGIALLAALAYWGAGDGVPEGWSAWEPKADGGIAAATEIADFVDGKYRMANGDQLVAVKAGPLEVQDLPLSVVMRTAPQGGNIEVIEGNGVMYTLNGLGKNGSIAKGKPSEARHLVLRREALELALYTFRYAEDIDMVVALLPPRPPDPKATGEDEQTQVQALFFRPGDLEAQLDAPIEVTIPQRATPRPETLQVASRAAAKIDALTRRNLFLATFQPGQDAGAYLVLDRPPS